MLIPGNKSVMKSEVSSARFSVPSESSILIKAPKQNRFSTTSSNDNRDTAASVEELNNDQQLRSTLFMTAVSEE
jgi:hypothetical protein